LPMGCHMTLKAGNNRISLSGPMGETIRRGGIFSTSISYWENNVCRSGWVVEGESELPEKAHDYMENFAGVYFEAMNKWFSMLKIGANGNEAYKVMAERLPFEKFGVVLNPGHLTGLEEWISTPYYPGSQVKLHSGMAFQADVIPHSKTYYTTRMEDGYVLANEKLRKDLKEQYPDCYGRCMMRREFLTGVLGIELGEEILPLSNICALVPPFLLNPNIVFAMK
jgi:hypothetical protein